jgi:alpha-beta hydrolase superfamily lysophospholipase
MSQPEPLFFGPEDRPLFAWLHRSRSPARLGLVVCNPFGYEAICAHRGLRHFAEAAAAAGVPALRFDYDGTGDSAGDDNDPARLAAWIGSVHHAADALRRLTGVEKVVLLGLRLGALIATRAAAERDDVDSLIVIAPVVSGKAYLRELRALQMALSLPAAPPTAPIDAGVQEALGFPLTAATRAELGCADLALLERPPAPAVLLIERDDLPGNDAWPRKLAALGVAVTRRRLPGYVELALGAEHTIVPEEMVRAAAEWVTARDARLGERPTDAAPTLEPPRRSCQIGNVIETAQFVDDGQRLFGVLTNPVSPPPRRRGLLLLNAGAVHHVGPNRLYVNLARRWATRGHAVLRLDVSGIGDSRARPGDRENVVYGDGAIEDVTRALQFLRRQPGVTEIHAIGLCSGGYHAFKAAVAGVSMDGVLLINPLTFFFKPDEGEDKGEAAVSGETSRYLRRLRDPQAWAKLLRSGVDLRVPLRTFARFAVTRLRGRAEELARRIGLEVGDDLERELRTIVSRRTALRFVFSAGDPGFDLLRFHGGATAERLRRAGQISVDVIDGADHTFTPLWSHGMLTSALAAHFDASERTPP